MKTRPTVTPILKFISEHCEPLYEKHGFWFVETRPPILGGACASMILARENFSISFGCEKAQYLIDITCPLVAKKYDWYGIYLLWDMMGVKSDSLAFMTVENANLICEHMEKILELFKDKDSSEKSWQSIQDIARKQSKQRYKRLSSAHSPTSPARAPK